MLSFCKEERKKTNQAKNTQGNETKEKSGKSTLRNQLVQKLAEKKVLRSLQCLNIHNTKFSKRHWHAVHAFLKAPFLRTMFTLVKRSLAHQKLKTECCHIMIPTEICRSLPFCWNRDLFEKSRFELHGCTVLPWKNVLALCCRFENKTETCRQKAYPHQPQIGIRRDMSGWIGNNFNGIRFINSQMKRCEQAFAWQNADKAHQCESVLFSCLKLDIWTNTLGHCIIRWVFVNFAKGTTAMSMRFGYFHLWTRTHPSREAYLEWITQKWGSPRHEWRFPCILIGSWWRACSRTSARDFPRDFRSCDFRDSW